MVGDGRIWQKWLIESFFSAFKRWFGKYVVSKRLENMKKELIFKTGIMNVLVCAKAV